MASTLREIACPGLSIKIPITEHHSVPTPLQVWDIPASSHPIHKMPMSNWGLIHLLHPRQGTRQRAAPQLDLVPVPHSSAVPRTRTSHSLAPSRHLTSLLPKCPVPTVPMSHRRPSLLLQRLRLFLSQCTLSAKSSAAPTYRSIPHLS